ncbi:SNF2-related protein [Desulforamulus ruminis]|uniref:DEAD-like helicase n=1 Tax=Desulforamulus ruminis (strain ATCC 23193 / DSM 2154 / NCIMB 8452 / DL) TaxID=696281 RepID=F6DM17_DESRL|nr:DEAD/DEAH box helicase [Desulforamulus ruminis]AEG59359.1 DEAD-like helicase [Desulforamulus ruminis DSM 2154]
MQYVPYPYQEFATQYILEKPGVGLFFDMGMRKTVCTLTAVEELLYDRFEVSRVLVIGPLRVAQDVWIREVRKWDHLQQLRVSRVLGSRKERIAALKAPADIWVINRENVEWLVNYYGKAWPFDMVVIDELSSFRNPSARRFKALRKIRPLVKRWVGLTGTPRPKSLLDLWAQVYLLDGGERLGKTYTGYRERYFEPDQRNRTTIFSWKPKTGAEEAIYKMISGICISMPATGLPPIEPRIVKIPLPPEARQRYNQLERDMLLPYVDGDVVAFTAASLGTKLLQMANGAVYDEHKQVREIHDAKLKALEEVLEEFGEWPVMVFYAYQHDRDRILRHFQGKRIRTLDDSKDIDDWNTGKISILLAHPASTGHGLNLQEGGHVIIWFGLTQDLELYQQGNGRLRRPGQEHDCVIVVHLVVEGTHDEDVLPILGGKAKGQDALLTAVKARIERVQKGGPPLCGSMEPAGRDVDRGKRGWRQSAKNKAR